MAFLDTGGVGGGDVQQDIRKFLHFAAGFASEGYGVHPYLLGRLENVEDVSGVAGGGDAHDDVPVFGGAAQEAGEGEVVAEVVGGGGEVGAVAVECLGVEGRAVEVEASRQFCGEVLCVGGAAAIAAEVDLSAAA